MVCMRCEHPVEKGAHYCSRCGAPVEPVEPPSWRREQAERLLREAMSLNEHGRDEEALLACEGALALEPELLPALSLKALLHEKRGQIAQAIETYQRVVQLNPLSVSERARLEALQRQPRAAVRVQSLAARPLWLDALPAVLAFVGAGVVLVVGFVALLRLSAPTTSPAPSVAPARETVATSPQTAPQPSAPAVNLPAQPEPSTPTVPPVMVDPSRLAIAPASEASAPPRGSIPAPSTQQSNTAGPPSKSSQLDKPANAADTQSELLPDVEVRERPQEGVYEIYVHKNANAPAEPSPLREDPLEIARRHQMAGNYQQAIEAYQQALPTAPSQGEVYQQIAICYLRLGDKANARANFQQAIQAYQLQIQRGQEVNAAREGIRACEQGLKLCEE